jgi:hypothetical protein
MEDENVNNAPSDIVVVIRPSLKRACCEGDACRAAIFNQLLYCIAWKLTYDKDYWYGSYEEIYTKLLDESWGLSKVIKEVKVLIEQGFIEQRRNPTKGWDQTRQYLFGKEQAKKFKEACEKANISCIEHQMGFPPDVIHLLKITNAIGETNKCICQIQQNDPANLTNASVKINDATSKTSAKETTKKGAAPFPDFCLEKLTQVARDCGEEVEQHRAEAERIYQGAGKSGDDFCDLLYGVEALIKMYGPRTMQEFFRQLYATLEAK